MAGSGGSKRKSAKKKTAETKKATKRATSKAAADYPMVEVTSRAELRAWLVANHEQQPGAWIDTWKKSADPTKYVAYGVLVEELLCVGWVDTKSGLVDENRTSHLCTPRKPSSFWSRSNKERIARLDAAGLLLPRGRELVRIAQETGTWTALDDVEDLVVPPDLAAALDQHPPAASNFDAFPRSAKRGILEWILQAKRPETRAKRVHETATRAQQNERANQWKRAN